MRSPTLLALVAPLLLLACDKHEAPPATKSDAVTTTAAATATPKEGDAAPDVDLALQDGKHVKLASLQGKNVVLYFYPKDQTTGCTIEAQDFKARHDELVKAGITVIGVSTQDAASHQAFIEKEQLPFSSPSIRTTRSRRHSASRSARAATLHARPSSSARTAR